MIDVLFRLGETKRFLLNVTADADITVSAVTFDLYEEDGDSVLAGAAGSFTENSARDWDVWYNWTPATAGDYYGTLFYTQDGQVRGEPVKALVWPATSKLDRYIARAQGLAAEAQEGAAQVRLSWRGWRDSVLDAVRAYEQTRPRRLVKTITLAASDWEYALSDLAVGASPAAAWANDFSQIEMIDAPYDSTVQSRAYLYPGRDWVIDEPGAVLRFVYYTPATGDLARVHWTARHTLSHTVDTLPAADFEALCHYAAGAALIRLGSEAAHRNDPQIEAAVTNARDQTARLAAQAKELMGRAKMLWRVPSFNF